MKLVSTALGAALIFLTATVSLEAMPRTPEKLRALLADSYGGDPVAYVNAKPNHFREMGNKGRTDLVQVLMDAGLVLSVIDSKPREAFIFDTIMKSRAETLAAALDPDSITLSEDRGKGENTWTPLWRAIYKNNYDVTLLILQNGPSRTFNHRNYLQLTREEHLVLAASWAIKRGKNRALQAFSDAGYGHIVEVARNKAAVDYIDARAGIKSKGDGGSMLGAVAGVVGGMALGGDLGSMIALEGGLAALDQSSGNASEGSGQAGGPLQLATNRAHLGLQLQTVLEPRRGMLVAKVVPDHPGDLAGIQQGDVIVAIAGQPVAYQGSLWVSTEIAAKQEAYVVDYFRGDERLQATLSQFQQTKPEVEKSPSSGSRDAPTTEAAKSRSSSMIEQLERIADLRDRGVLSDDEFDALKAEILAGEGD